MAFVTSERHLWNVFRLRTNDGTCHQQVSSSCPDPRLAGMKSEQYGQEVSFAFDFRAHLIPQLDWLNRSCVRRIGKDSSKCEMRSRGAVVCGEEKCPADPVPAIEEEQKSKRRQYLQIRTLRSDHKFLQALLNSLEQSLLRLQAQRTRTSSRLRRGSPVIPSSLQEEHVCLV